MHVVFAYSDNWYSDLVLSSIREKCQNLTIYKNKITEFPDQYDLGISFLYQYRIPKCELDKSRWVNFHPGPLPEFGGRNLAYHAIMNESKEFGGTIHYMDENFDTGPIIDVERFTIAEEMTAHDLVWGSYSSLFNLYNKYIDRLLSGETLPSSRKKITYYRTSKINNYIELDKNQIKRIRALTCNNFKPLITTGKREYKIEKT